jgi:hypothetical protein
VTAGLRLRSVVRAQPAAQRTARRPEPSGPVRALEPRRPAIGSSSQVFAAERSLSRQQALQILRNLSVGGLLHARVSEQKVTAF